MVPCLCCKCFNSRINSSSDFWEISRVNSSFGSEKQCWLLQGSCSAAGLGYLANKRIFNLLLKSSSSVDSNLHWNLPPRPLVPMFSHLSDQKVLPSIWANSFLLWDCQWTKTMCVMCVLGSCCPMGSCRYPWHNAEPWGVLGSCGMLSCMQKASLFQLLCIHCYIFLPLCTQHFALCWVKNKFERWWNPTTPSHCCSWAPVQRGQQKTAHISVCPSKKGPSRPGFWKVHLGPSGLDKPQVWVELCRGGIWRIWPRCFQAVVHGTVVGCGELAACSVFAFLVSSCSNTWKETKNALNIS